MPYQTQAQAVLAEWRQVERQLAETPSDSISAELLRAEASRLRDAYQLLVDAQLGAAGPPLPPLPLSTTD
jgi:hypothetical protein